MDARVELNAKRFRVRGTDTQRLAKLWENQLTFFPVIVVMLNIRWLEIGENGHDTKIT